MTTFALWLVWCVAATTVAAVVTRGLIAWTRSRGIVDAPNERSMHSRTTPRGGGLAIVAVVVAAALVVVALRPGAAWEIGAVVLPALAVAAVSWLDDVREVSNRGRFAVHLTAAVATAVALGPVTRVDLGSVAALRFGLAGAALAFLWLAGLTNAFNFMDGLDGLAAATATIAACFLAIVAHRAGAGPVAALAWALAAGSAGFLLLNWPPARIFMGDVGSQFLGFAFAGIGILLAREGGIADGAGILVVPVLLANFLFDTGFTAFQRWRRGARLWEAHREHLYQRLNRAGHGHRTVTLRVAGIAVACGIASPSMRDAASAWACVGLAFALQCAWLAVVLRAERRARQG